MADEFLRAIREGAGANKRQAKTGLANIRSTGLSFEPQQQQLPAYDESMLHALIVLKESRLGLSHSRLWMFEALVTPDT